MFVNLDAHQGIDLVVTTDVRNDATSTEDFASDLELLTPRGPDLHATTTAQQETYAFARACVHAWREHVLVRVYVCTCGHVYVLRKSVCARECMACSVAPFAIGMRICSLVV